MDGWWSCSIGAGNRNNFVFHLIQLTRKRVFRIITFSHAACLVLAVHAEVHGNTIFKYESLMHSSIGYKKYVLLKEQDVKINSCMYLVDWKLALLLLTAFFNCNLTFSKVRRYSTRFLILFSNIDYLLLYRIVKHNDLNLRRKFPSIEH